MMEETKQSIGTKKRGKKRRALVWLVLLAALGLGLGFAVTQGQIDLSETLSAVREISEDATHDLRSTVDAAVNRASEPEEDLAATVSELEARLARLEARTVEPSRRGEDSLRPSDKETRLGRRIEFELFSTEAFNMNAIDVDVADGQVTLSGTVSVEAERVLAERIAEDVPGVTEVVNELRIE